MAAAAAPAQPPEVLLVACGSFSPPTLMHLRMMEVARDCLMREHGVATMRGVLSFGRAQREPAVAARLGPAGGLLALRALCARRERRVERLAGHTYALAQPRVAHRARARRRVPRLAGRAAEILLRGHRGC